jgi:phosphonatase-like hydrolase
MFSNKLILNNSIKAIVCDMAGTTINEGGIIYKILYSTMKNFNLNIGDESIMKKWHGANKYEVLDYYLMETYNNKKYFNEFQPKLHRILNNNLIESYSNPENLSLINKELPNLFNNIRENGIKVFLNTGYPIEVQKSIIKSLNMEEFIDDYISSEEVYKGRPTPYMIDALLVRNNINYPNKVINYNQVIKLGDTTNDILEGKNSKCYKSVGVLSGADDESTLSKAGADIIINSVMDIELEK